MNAANGLYRLVGQIQNYAWGGCGFIPRLLGLEPAPGTHYAEYWLGAHEKAPSTAILEDGRAARLNELIAQDPHRVLGLRVALGHGQLPYLFKVLDVATPLSIQAHPTRLEAEAGFERETRLGIPVDSPKRNYRDRNHKPELVVALSDFWLLHGFLPEAQLFDVLREVPEFRALRAIFETGGLAGLYRHVMEMPPHEVEAILVPLGRRILGGRRDGLEKCSADYWAAKALANRKTGPHDRGILSIYFLNLIKLKPGQAIYQDAGTPHAYLTGQSIEIMANSDNVVRGGLTDKHVDVAELLRTVRFEGIQPKVIKGRSIGNPVEAFYETPASEFRLGHILLGKGEAYASSTESTEIVLGFEGEAIITSGSQCLPLNRGQSAVLFAGTDYRITALSGSAALFRVSVPRQGPVGEAFPGSW